MDIEYYREEFYENMKREAKRNGISVQELTRLSNDDLGLAMIDYDSIYISLNRRPEDPSKAYILAHELSHLLKDPEVIQGEVMAYSSLWNNRAEQIAQTNALLYVADDYFQIDNGGHYYMSKINDFIEFFLIDDVGIEQIEYVFETYRSKYFNF